MLDLFSKLGQYMAKRRDDAFERKYGLNTSDKRLIVVARDLQTVSLYRENATAYQGVWFDIIEMLMNAAQKDGIDLSKYTFVDVGSGMGKACFCASEFGFKKLRGFDFEESLVEKSKENLAIMKSKKEIDVDFFVADATEVLLPSEPTFLFFYHPFDHIVMKKFFDNNFSRLPKDVVIGYANDQFRHVLEDFGFEKVFRNNKRRTSLWKLKGN